MNWFDEFMQGIRIGPRCRIEDACNKVSRQMYRREDRQWWNGMDAGAGLAFVSVMVVLLVAWGLS